MSSTRMSRKDLKPDVRISSNSCKDIQNDKILLGKNGLSHLTNTQNDSAKIAKSWIQFLGEPFGCYKAFYRISLDISFLNGINLMIINCKYLLKSPSGCHFDIC